ncbi:MAG TPA: DUF4332 domain-containing protein [Flavobacteriaceae bacterium]|nr:DUF4332 domain-containing protein [Flavobacteriaceae bacterium]
MAYKIEEIESIGPATAAKMAKAGITTVEDLMEQAHSKAGRKKVSELTGIGESQLLTFVNMGDLMRIKGVGSEFSELLQASGVDTVKEFRTRNAANLEVKMNEVNATKKLTRRVPTESQLQEFINIAKTLEPMVTH